MNQSTPNRAKPFIKWAGGKGRLLSNIASRIPSWVRASGDITYVEPFVGGGALLFWILQEYPNITKAIINDINPDLTLAYRVVRDSAQQLIDLLEETEKHYFAIESEEQRKEYYLQQRAEFNLRNSGEVEQTARFIFLNRTCFNGLYRVNKKGAFNVPFGRYAKPKICDKETILASSALLARVEILTGDFEQTLQCAKPGALFYFDPPYRPISKTSSFTTYTKEDFDDADQTRLGAFCDKISDLGASFILSNSDPKSADSDDVFLDALYQKFRVGRVLAPRMINSNAGGRGKINEMLVSNF